MPKTEKHPLSRMPFLRLERQDGAPINQAGGGLCAFPAGAAGTDPETRL